MAKKTVKDVELKGKRVLMRADFNVPLDNGVITDNSRIVAALPTIEYILAQEPSALILMTHVGRPKSADDTQFSTKPIADELSTLLDQQVIHVHGVVGNDVQQAVADAPAGSVLLLENTRYEKGDTKNDPDLSEKLAALADLYVNDAFGTAHRANASTEGVAQAIKARGGAAVAGFLIGKELDALGAAVENPEHPYIAIMGGAKISDKIQLIDHILQKADKVLIGGGMANTFLAAQGHSMGKSLVEQDAIPEAKRLMKQFGDRLVLPVDVAIADTFSNDAKGDLRKVHNIPHDKMALDIGPGTMELFEEIIEDAALVIWNGPMGVFEFENFSQGTFGIAHILADAVENGATVIIGGGDSAAAVREAGLTDNMSHVSTGGGASLELLEGKTLPGIAALDDK
jgi:phosphoglycerate kinase